MRRALLELKSTEQSMAGYTSFRRCLPGYADETTPNIMPWHGVPMPADCLWNGSGDGIWLTQPELPAFKRNAVAFGVLQAARVRISKTEYISCPSCGRTLFDLQETTALIRSQTDLFKRH
jgi:(E)-4-hydroxy-3-methylbut-2-enyl-diphosphate synthase